jgi:hypothetical protein
LYLDLKEVTHNSADTSRSSSRNGCKEGCRALLNQGHKDDGSNDVFGVGKHIDNIDLKNSLLK